jgi:hypothetical protein
MGSLFIGSDQQHTFMIFDTKTKFSVVILNEASGEHPINNYELEESLTKKGVQVDAISGNPQQMSIRMDHTIFNGNFYQD